jgi:serine/threonine-protein kinase RsbT
MSPPGENETKLTINSDLDIVFARQKGREMSKELGFSLTDATLIATAISELARNIVKYARKGNILLAPVDHNGRRGIRVVALDEGPGVRDIELAMRDGYSTSGSLGLGLPGTRRLMDEFEIVSNGNGTRVTTIKWVR